MAKDAKGHGSDARGGGGGAQAPAHQGGVNQVGQESDASRDLRMYGDNDSDLYRQSYTPIVNNLGQKMDKGVYDSSSAATLWGYHADRVAQALGKYNNQSGNDSRPWHQQFPTSVRREAAANWEREERPNIASGEHGNPYAGSAKTKLADAWNEKHGK